MVDDRVKDLVDILNPKRETGRIVFSNNEVETSSLARLQCTTIDQDLAGPHSFVAEIQKSQPAHTFVSALTRRPQIRLSVLISLLHLCSIGYMYEVVLWGGGGVGEKSRSHRRTRTCSISI